MTETKWSPGPWYFDRRLDEIIDANKQFVVEMLVGLRSRPEDIARSRADGRLIAAAPELYEALKLAEPYLRETTYWQQVASALAKAEGRKS